MKQRFGWFIISRMMLTQAPALFQYPLLVPETSLPLLFFSKAI